MNLRTTAMAAVLCACMTGAVSAAMIVTAEANKSTITVTAKSASPGNYRLEALRPWQISGGVNVWNGKISGQQKLSFARVQNGEDLLFRRFRLVDAKTGLSTKTQYVTEFSGNSRGFRIPWPASRKGMSCPWMIDDLVTLGVKHITTNINLIGVLKPPEDVKPGEPVIEVDGERYGINMDTFRGFDKQFKELTDAGMNIFAVINNPIPSKPDPSNPFIHPETDLANAPMHLGAFNITNDRGLKAYRAVIGFFAERYSRPDCKYGWVSSYIVGNEVQAHWSWYNMGRPSDQHFLDEYIKAVRVTDLILRDTHPDLRAFVSMEHHWTAPVDMQGDVVLEGLAKRSTMEGNFPWDVAFHPYPQDLFKPNFLKDDQALLRYDTPKITFKNLEVLPDFLSQPRFLYKGKLRRIALTEQGFNADPTPEGEQMQAAAYAAAYYRVAHINGIVAFNLHRHVSARDEFGLRLGVWDFPDVDNPYTGKLSRKLPSWDAFRLSGTPEADQKLAYLLPVLGAKSWQQLLPSKNIDRSKPKPAFAGKNLVADLCLLIDRAKLDNLQPGLEWRKELVSDGVTHMSAIYSHPPKTGTGYGTMDVKLPVITKKQKLVFVTSTGFINDSTDGVDWFVMVNGKQLATGTQTTRGWIARRIDLSSYAGQTIHLGLGVNARKELGADWFCWTLPAVLKVSASSK